MFACAIRRVATLIHFPQAHAVLAREWALASAPRQLLS
jgi:hypothetical protein